MHIDEVESLIRRLIGEGWQQTTALASPIGYYFRNEDATYFGDNIVFCPPIGFDAFLRDVNVCTDGCAFLQRGHTVRRSTDYDGEHNTFAVPPTVVVGGVYSDDDAHATSTHATADEETAAAAAIQEIEEYARWHAVGFVCGKPDRVFVCYMQPYAWTETLSEGCGGFSDSRHGGDDGALPKFYVAATLDDLRYFADLPFDVGVDADEHHHAGTAAAASSKNRA